MRKLKLQMQMTVDGFIAGPNGEMDFFTWNWDDELKAYTQQLTDSIGTIVLGRKLAEGFIPHWAGVAADASNPEQPVGDLFTRVPKLVFSRTLTQSSWPNTTLAKGELAATIQQLKQAQGKDIMAYGGADFVGSLLQHRLVDELHLFVNPVAIGQGMSIFHKLEGAKQLQLVAANPFACGIVVLQYQLG